MSVIISSNNYGKSQVRLLKVKRKGNVHDVTEITVNIQLEGKFETVHTNGDNREVLPTDTMKNTVYALAKENPVNSPEEFGLFLSNYFLKNNKQVSKVSVEISEKLWKRIKVKNKSNEKEFINSDHSFISSGNEKKTTKIISTEKRNIINSGLKDLLVLKTTDSAFENFVRDKYTTLKEASDRIFSTSITAVWSYANQDINYLMLHENIRQIILEIFANHKSLSVQHTLYEIGKKVIELENEVSEISLTMPNKHYLLFNLEQFNMRNENEIFIPTDEPFGLIEATIKRSE